VEWVGWVVLETYVLAIVQDVSSEAGYSRDHALMNPGGIDVPLIPGI
jgi:hypothetical protein